MHDRSVVNRNRPKGLIGLVQRDMVKSEWDNAFHSEKMGFDFELILTQEVARCIVQA